MTFDRACTLLGIATGRDLATCQMVARFTQASLVPSAPLRMSVACTLILRATSTN